MNLLRCLRIAEMLLGGLFTRGEVSQMWVRQLHRTRPVQEVWLPVCKILGEGIFRLPDLDVPGGSA